MANNINADETAHFEQYQLDLSLPAEVSKDVRSDFYKCVPEMEILSVK